MKKVIEVGDLFDFDGKVGVVQVEEINRKKDIYTLGNENFDITATAEEIESNFEPVVKAEELVKAAPKPKIEIDVVNWPKWLSWAAMDEDGQVNFHKTEPNIKGEHLFWADDTKYLPVKVPVGYFTYKGDWKDSLTKRPE